MLILYWFRKNSAYRILLVCSVSSILITGSWYLKNFYIFHSFSTSSWLGMNIARNVFHDVEIIDSGSIATIEPFSKISAYRNFVPPDYEKSYEGLNDRDLLKELKNDSFINEKNVRFIPVSKAYLDASKSQIAQHPKAYVKNVLESAIIFFAPATRYPTTEFQANKIPYYDLLYSFNLTHFAKGKQERRIALTLSAFPKAVIYLLVFYLLVRNWIKKREIILINLFIALIIAYIFCISSLFEHYENMRFRFEVEPLFLILAGQVAAMISQKKVFRH